MSSPNRSHARQSVGFAGVAHALASVATGHCKPAAVYLTNEGYKHILRPRTVYLGKHDQGKTHEKQAVFTASIHCDVDH